MTLAIGDQIVAVLPMPNGGGDLMIFTAKGAIYRLHVADDGVTPSVSTLSAAGASIGNGN